MRKIQMLTAFLALLVIVVSCRRENNYYNVADVVKQWTLTMNTANENPVPAGRNETANLTIQLLSDKSLRYEIVVKNLKSGDYFTAAHIHTGDPVTNGPVLIDMKPAISNDHITGLATGLRQSFVDSLNNPAVQLYFNIHSNQVPSGLLRAQLNSVVTFTADVSMNGAQEVPPVTTTATGIALFRLTADNTLYSKVTVSNLETSDGLTAAHIHTGAPGANGPILIPLAASAADFGASKSNSLSAAQKDALLNARLYVNAHTTNNPSGKIRGQLR